MCLTVNKSNLSTSDFKIASKNIVVYKVLLNNYFGYRSAFQNHNYYQKDQINIELKLDDIISSTYVNTKIEKGYHSYKNIKDAINYKRKSLIKNNLVVCKFIIPKGAYYIGGFYNGNMKIPNYVSTNIIFKEDLTNLTFIQKIKRFLCVYILQKDL